MSSSTNDPKYIKHITSDEIQMHTSSHTKHGQHLVHSRISTFYCFHQRTEPQPASTFSPTGATHIIDLQQPRPNTLLMFASTYAYTPVLDLVCVSTIPHGPQS
mmetsp:Transcript_1791/g.4314  ORF Transcript_1791/g.4314 Transcript_1791/m.4314 type:complete len:103 (-) Transcript_1791:29-337(-)